MALTETAVVVLGPSGLDTALRIVAAIPGARLHGRRARVADADTAFDEVAPHLRRVFGSGTPMVVVAASGIVIRALASALEDKASEPPVLAVADDGSSVVPLLGGHHGANALARRIAEALGGHAAITTASDVGLGVVLDEPPAGWRVRDPATVKAVTSALLAGAPVRLVVDAGDADWLAALRFANHGRHTVRVTDKDVAGGAADLVFHPPVLALGIGCERGVEVAAIEALVDRALHSAGLTRLAVACVVSLDLKADEPAIEAFARGLGRPFRVFTAAELEAETPRLANPSDAVFAEVGCHGVAEAAALRAAGPAATLIVPKLKGERATCAIARGPRAIDAAGVGRGRGSLAIVGLGPGEEVGRTLDVNRAIRDADAVVGYQGYLELMGESARGKTLYPFALGEEEVRCAHALALAAEGRRVALVCSGDPGVYAMASLVLEVQDRATDAAWRRVAVEVVPGVSAMQTAAARAGAPLGHDFCAISLSDLMTPWHAIARRIEAAGQGDFVVAFYNPVSARRREGLAKARAILLRHRTGATPVVLGRNLGRDGETVRVTTLGDLSVDEVDMLTVVIVGSTATRRFEAGGRTRVYTPRGYRVAGADA